MTAGPAAIAAALRKSRRLSSSAMGPPIPIYPMIAAVPGNGVESGQIQALGGTNLSRFGAIFRLALVIRNELFDSRRDKFVPLSRFSGRFFLVRHCLLPLLSTTQGRDSGTGRGANRL